MSSVLEVMLESANDLATSDDDDDFNGTDEQVRKSLISGPILFHKLCIQLQGPELFHPFKCLCGSSFSN